MNSPAAKNREFRRALTQKYRRDTDRRLLVKLQEFVRTAPPEEKSIMAEILQVREAENLHSEHEIVLLSAFEEVMNNTLGEDMVFRVPEEFRHDVAAYIDRLKAGQGRLVEFGARKAG